MSKDNKPVSRAQAIAKLWSQGILSWKLYPIQKNIRSYIETSKNGLDVILMPRQIGKSHLLVTLAFEQCLKTPNSIVKYVCPKKKMVKTIIGPIVDRLTEDCPPELKPEFKTNDSMYLFPNGSQIQLAGSDNGHAETIRGGYSHICIVDEAGFVDDLSYVVRSILFPTTDTTGGKVILASTPSKMPTHDFIVEFVKPQELLGKLIKYTIYDNPRMSPERIENEILSRYPGGVNNPEFRREYLCEIFKDEEDSVIPEYDDRMELRTTREWTKPPRYNSYVSMDIGFKDFTVVLFAYYDFLNAKIIICDELVLSGKEVLTENLIKFVEKKEAENFSDKVTGEIIEPKRIADNNNLILLNDIRDKTGMIFLPTAKDNKEAAINKLRELIANEKIIFSPKCQITRAHVKNASWNKARTQFARITGYGHFDAVDSLLYLIRNIDYHINPYPKFSGSSDTHWITGNAERESESIGALKRIFRLNK